MGNRNSGRKPEPNKLKLLRGVTRADRLNPAEPQPPSGEVKPPGSLSHDALAVWGEIAPLCIDMGTLTTADVLPFAEMCELLVTAGKASAEKDRPGFSIFLVTTTVDGAGNEHQNVKEHPALRLERATAGTLRPYFDYFGMTPAGRAKIRVGKPDAPVSKWAGALA